MEILYNDGDICLVIKPAGLAVHKSKLTGGEPSLVEQLSDLFEVPPCPVHRLDKPTSGLVLCAHSREAASILSEAFREGRVGKQYLAIVRGWPEDNLNITEPLNRYDHKGKSLKDSIPPQDAETYIKCINKADLPYPNNRYTTTRFSLLAVFPKTGRFHQIRRHLAGKGYPVVGDTSHGDTRINHLVAGKTGHSRLMLHACSLTFTHPRHGREMFFSCLPAGSFRRFAAVAGWDLENQIIPRSQ